MLNNDPFLGNSTILGPPLETSDHKTISFDINIYKDNIQLVESFDFARRNYEVIAKFPKGVNWIVGTDI